jgi:hypothetical protein
MTAVTGFLFDPLNASDLSHTSWRGRVLSGPTEARPGPALWAGGLLLPAVDPAGAASYAEFVVESAGRPGRWRIGFGITAAAGAAAGASAAYGVDAWVYYCGDGSVWHAGRREGSWGNDGAEGGLGGCAKGERVGLLVENGR